MKKRQFELLLDDLLTGETEQPIIPPTYQGFDIEEVPLTVQNNDTSFGEPIIEFPVEAGNFGFILNFDGSTLPDFWNNPHISKKVQNFLQIFIIPLILERYKVYKSDNLGSCIQNLHHLPIQFKTICIEIVEIREYFFSNNEEALYLFIKWVEYESDAFVQKKSMQFRSRVNDVIDD